MVPKDRDLRNQILDEAHSSKLSIHSGSSKMYQDLKTRFWWTKMKKEVTTYVARCDNCSRVKATHLKYARLLQSLPILSRKWGGISMDFITSLPLTQQGHYSIWVIVDRPTKSAHFLPVHTRYLARKYAELYISPIMRLDGVPRTIILDQGPQFIACFREHLHQALGTKLIRSSTYHPQTSG